MIDYAASGLIQTTFFELLDGQKRSLGSLEGVRSMTRERSIYTSPRTSAALELTPDLSRGLVAEYAWLDPIKVAQSYGCEMLALNWTHCTPERLEKAQRQGLHVSVWTVNEPALMRRLADFGVDSLITDFPGLATATLGNG